MTTILADFRLGVMVADSSISDGDRVWIGRKVYRYKGSIIGFSGEVDESIEFMRWWRRGCGTKPPKFSHSNALVLSESGLLHFASSCTGIPVESGIEAIGSGGKAAICTYEAMGFTDPVAAVKLVCKHDAGSRTPVRTYRMKP